MSNKRPIKNIAICGGGIGGLTLAAIISQNCNIHVDIYEAKTKISAIEAGIAIWKRSWQVLQHLGLDEEVKKRNIPFPKEGEARGPIFRKAGQYPDYTGVDFHNHMMPYGPTSVGRDILLDMLKSRLSANCVIHNSKRLTEYRVEPTQSITLVFSDGSTASADVLVGTDGVHSPTRATMYKNLAKSNPSVGYDMYIDPVWTGTYAYRCRIDLQKFKRLYPGHQVFLHPKIWCGKDKHVVSIPMSNFIRLICYVTVKTEVDPIYDGPWVTDVLPEEIIDCYKGWEPDLMQLLEHSEQPSRWAIHVTRHLPFSASGRVALLGDSAHAMLPHQGVGGGQAIEDAHILGHLLANPNASLDRVEDILRIYQEICLPLGTKAAERSHSNGLMYEFNHPDFPAAENMSAADLEILGEAVGTSFAWLAEGSCDDDLKRAEAMFAAISNT